MYYTALREGLGYPRGLYISIALATSPDGWTFTPHEAGALLKPDLGNLSRTSAAPSPRCTTRAIATSSGNNTAGEKYRLRYAESRDGINFDVDPNVVCRRVGVGVGRGYDGVPVHRRATGPGPALLLRGHVCGHRGGRATEVNPIPIWRCRHVGAERCPYGLCQQAGTGLETWLRPTPPQVPRIGVRGRLLGARDDIAGWLGAAFVTITHTGCRRRHQS